ncbi:MAG: tyrosine--tRNA ligase [Rhodospirillaceae bacterium]|nr:tyrosine--tRNA ligase [Rhodospirillaceae bacterium]
MATTKSDLIHTLTSRGYLHQCTDLAGLDEKAASVIVTGYIGFDATADSLHIGHLVQIMMLRRLQQAGHRPIALMGGGTTKIGDPSGRDETRALLDNAAIDSNIAKIQETFDRFLTFGGTGKTDAILANNAEWLDKLEYIPFLRDIGRHFTVNKMLTMDSVKLRLDREQPLTFLEFNYMILQGYDFVELYRRHGCTLQLGGSDQWGNIVQGVDLGRRIAGAELFGFTTPLIMTSSGQKMGKSVSGAVWLGAHRLAPYDYYQFWRNTEDGDVGRFMKLFTDLPLDEIARYEALQGAEINEGKKKLAFEATALLHGREAAEAAAETARKTFEEGAAGDALPTVTAAATTSVMGKLNASIGGSPLITPRITVFLNLLDPLIQLGFAASKGEVRRHIASGAVRIENEKVTDENYQFIRENAMEGELKISMGKKRHGIIKWKAIK